MIAFPQPLTSVAAPLNPGALMDNVDTDAIIPSREMRSTGRTGLAEGLFAPWRYTNVDARTLDPDFALNQPKFARAQILVAGANFGCGSSREHAVWALAEFGVRAVLAESFAPIFHDNCIRNFLLPITLPRPVLERLAGERLMIDLAEQTVSAGGESHAFAIDREAKQMLAQGLDAIDFTLDQSDAIKDWIKSDRTERPWIYLEAQA